MSQDVDHVLLLNLFHLVLTGWVREGLSDWVVLHFLLLHVGVSHLTVWFSSSLEVLLLLLVGVDLALPLIVVVGVTVFHFLSVSAD